MTDITKLAEGIVERAKRKIEQDGNGDVESMLLILATANFEGIQEVKSNPMILLGEIIKKYPKLAITAALVAWFMTGITVIMAIYGVAEQFGIGLIRLP